MAEPSIIERLLDEAQYSNALSGVGAKKMADGEEVRVNAQSYRDYNLYRERICREAADEIARLRANNERLMAALKPFAEVPPHSPPGRRCLVADANSGPYHFLQSDLDRAKEAYRASEQLP